ncbi:dNTP triphosphohydrolase, partial [Clostridium perfringens]|nr:dNTP triphosphohydrolase [Clostridium perfringens]
MEKWNKKYPELAADSEWAKRVNKEEEKHSIRSEFERDRDRVMYSKAFRRLSGKTQVFLAGNDDHVRTRLTHTLEVAQIARTIAKALGLNEELTEAIALGHDIGHTPFGHVGERMLNSIMNSCYKIRAFNNEDEILKDNKGFKHNWQSVRVATVLEPNMNLTNYTLWGMLKHSSLKYKKCNMKDTNGNCLFRHEESTRCENNLELDDTLSFYKNIQINNNTKKINIYEAIKKSWSFEGYVVAIADEIAQRHHDIEDALEYHILDEKYLLDKIKSIFPIGKDTTFKYEEDDERNFEELKKIESNNGSSDEYIP